MRSVRHLGLSLLNGLFLSLAMACGSGGGGGSTPAIQPPTALTYTTATAVYTVGDAITANSPSSSGGAVTSYGVSPALPAGLSLSATSGVISGTPTAIAALSTYTLTASNSAGSTTATLSITVNDVAPAGLTYTTTAATYTVGVPITANSPTSSGGAVSTYSVSPALPAGLSLSTITGIISGTPTAATASATYTVTATNTGGSATKDLTITVSGVAPANLTYTLTTAAYTKGVAITANSPSSSGGAVVSYSVSPALPTGLSLSTTTGVITGTPTAVKASATYTVTATNAGGNATKALTIAVNDLAPASLSYTLITATYTKGVAITSNSPSSSGGAVISYSVSPALPTGLSLSTTTGVITGTPTAVAATATYTVTATNTGGNATKALTISVNDVAPASLSYSLITATYTKGVAIPSNSPSSSGGAVASYGVSPALPAGLNLSTSTGVITGTPTAITASGTYTVTATNTGGSTTKDLTITVNDAAPTGLAYSLITAIYTKGLPVATNTPSSSGGTVVLYSVSPVLPAGLSLDTSTGIITGTPTAITGSGTYTVTATNTGGSTTKDLTITVNDAAPTSLAYTLATAIYTKGVVTALNSPSNSGGAVVSYSVSPALPAGLSLDTTTGIITGTPTAIVGSGTYTVTATNTGGSTTKDLTITVNDAAPTSLAYTLATAIYTKGVVVASNAPSNSGGTVVSYGVSPALPSGLSLDTTTGVITGTPTAIVGSGTYTVTATNTGGSTTKDLTITVNDAAPTSLAYTLATAIYTKGVVIASNAPSNSGGTVVSYGVSPALPAGLSLDTTTGVISGTPTVIAASGTCTVTATNTGGSTTKDLTITVNDAAPTALTYTLNPAIYLTNGVAIATNSPTSTGGAVVSYAVSPALPAGLTLNTTSGQITGTATTVTALATYTVTATNTGGNTTAPLVITVNPGPATAFIVSGYASPTISGTAHTVTVTAKDAAGNTATGYAGTVHLTSTDGAAVLGANATLTSGVGTFNVTLNTVGAQSITATDTVTSSITGLQAAITVNPGAAATLTVTGYANPTISGVAHNVTVTAKDAAGNTATGYAGTVHLTSSDGAAVLGANATLTSGVGTFSATLNTVGSRTITATDTVTSSITGSQAAITVNPGAATTLTVTGYVNPTVSGAAHTVTVTAKDAAGNMATSYAGTVHLTSTDGAAVLGANATLTSGVGTFNVTLNTVGTQSITATDTVTNSITGLQTAITVNPGAAATLTVTGYANPTISGVAHNVTVTAKDAAGNTATGYAGTVHLTSSDGAAVLGANATLTSGVGTFSVTLNTVGSRTITATDTVTSSITGTQTGIVVNSSAATYLTVTGYISPTISGASHTVTVTAKDAAGNTATGYAGTVHLTSTDGAAVLGANATLTSGVGTFNVTLNTVGAQSITATDTVTSSITGLQAAITVNPGAAATLTVAGHVGSTISGTANNFTVTAKDAAGNTATGYTGTVHFTSTDGSATLPGNYLFLSGDNGTHTFSATLKTAGSQSITATDTVTSSITGTQATIAVSAAAATHLSVTAFPSPTTAGNARTFTVTALDTYNNIAISYTGTVAFTSSDSVTTLPSSYTFLGSDNGAHSFSATLNTVGTQSISATDTVTGAITGTQSAISIIAAPSGYLVLPTNVHPNDTWMKASVTPQTGSMTYSWTTIGGGSITSGSATATAAFSAPASGTFQVNANIQNAASTAIDIPRTVTVKTTDSWLAKDGEASNREFATATVLPSGLVLVTGGLSVDYARLATAELYNPTTGLWVRTGDMHEARSKHTATLLQNGKVLVAGGLNASNYPLATAEIYDPATGLWTTTGGLATLRYNHTATLLSNGTVLVTGGTTNTAPTAVVEVYDPGATTWTTLAAMGTARSKHTATLLGNGTILIAGGTTTALATDVTTITELYTPAAGGSTVASGPLHAGRSNHTATLLNDGTTVLLAGGTVDGSTPLATSETWSAGTWTVATNMTTARMNHTATLLGNGKVLVVGDQAGSVQPYLSTTEFYSGGTWTATSAGLGTPRTNHTAALLNDGKVLVAGGTWNYIPNSSRYALTSSELFNPTNSTWAVTGSRVPVRYAHTATLLDDGTVLVAGGHDYGTTIDSSLIYTPGTGAWVATTAHLVQARRNNTATKLASGKVLVAGGVGTGGILATSELYDSSLGTWALAGSMISGRYNHTATLIAGGKVMVTGGIAVDGSSILNTVEIYDPAGNSWTTVTPMATPRAGHTATLLASGKVLVTGGTNFLDNLDIKKVEIYDPTLDTWTTSTPDMGAARHGHTATLIAGGKVLVNGGQNTGGALATAEIFDPAAAVGVGTWTATADMTGSGPSAASYGHTATLLPSGKVLVTGGLNGNNGLRSTAQTYDPGTGTWTAVALMIGARSSHTATLLSDGTVLVAFGSGGDTSTEVYKP